MKQLAQLKDVIGETLTLTHASAEMLALVFGDRFVILVAENSDPDFEPLRIAEMKAGDILDFGEGALIASGIATEREIFAARLDREEAQRKAAAEWRARQDAAEREQFERLKKKFGG